MLKKAFWYLTDSQWRIDYRKNQDRKKLFWRGQKDAMRYLIDQSTSETPEILSGPFKGMRWPAALNKTSYSAQMLLGTYELEIHHWIEEVIRDDYDLIIDIGAAEGFYAVGLAMRNPEIPIIAFEAEVAKHKTIKTVASSNSVKNLTIKEICQRKDIVYAVSRHERVLAIIDIDGGEKDLLCAASIPELRSIDMLIETHDGFVHGVTDLLKERFCETHTIEEIQTSQRTIEDIPNGVDLPSELAHVAMDEFRGMPQSWLFLRSLESR